MLCLTELLLFMQAYNGKETSSESHPLRFSVVRDHTKKKDVINFTGSHVIPPETHMPSEGKMCEIIIGFLITIDLQIVFRNKIYHYYINIRSE